MKKILIAMIIGMLAIGFNAVPAEAYTVLDTLVSVSATGTLTGDTETFTVSVVAQGTGTAATLEFDSTSGATADSGKALKIAGGTNEIDSRIIIYTDNNFNANVPDIDPATGIDGSGLVGETNPGYTVALLWGVNSAADYDPNSNVNYLFDGDTNDGVGEVYIVDTRHTHSFTTLSGTQDNAPMYTFTGTTNLNDPDDGLYPQRWDEDLYDAASGAGNVISDALYKTIATVAFGLGAGDDVDTNNYNCRVPNLSTAAPDDNVKGLLNLLNGTPDKSLYVYIAGNFVGKPAQVYSTTKLNVAMVQD